MRTLLRQSLVLLLFFTFVCGVVYPVAITALAQWWFPAAANGSPVTSGGSVVGSALIGQAAPDSTLFQPRPSAAGDGYDACASGGSNLGPTSATLVGRVRASADSLRRLYPGAGALPVDMVTASGSGLDPDITFANAMVQASRVARANRLPVARVEELIRARARHRFLGFLGEERVNVLELNCALRGGVSSR